jgi:hypothetical protein
MNRRNRSLTRALLLIAKEMESQIAVLSSVGVTVLGLESIQLDLISSILRMNGIKKGNECGDLVAGPIFSYMLDTLSLDECMKGMSIMLDQLEQERRGEADAIC